MATTPPKRKRTLLYALIALFVLLVIAAAIKARTEIEHTKQTVLRATEDFQEGVRSVAERRPGNFVGR